MAPPEIFRDHIFCCFIKETIGVELLDHFNVDYVFWESDYPPLRRHLAQRP